MLGKFERVNAMNRLLAFLLALLSTQAFAQVTSSTSVSRLQLQHPDFGHVGGTSLHNKVRTLYTTIGDNMDSRYVEYTGVANSAVTTVDHNFNIPFADMVVILWSGVGAAKTRIADPAGAGWTIAATGGFTKTKIDITAPSSGGPHDFSVEIHSGLKGMAVQSPAAVAITGGDITSANLSSGVVQDNLYFEEPSGSDRVAITAPALAAPYTLTLPTTDGNSNQVLTTDGGGNLSWADVAIIWQAKTTTYTAVAGDHILADTSGGAFTITLPASPSLGQTVTLLDAAGTWGTNNLTIDRNGSNINGSASNFTADVNNASIEFVYYNGSQGWRVRG